MGIILRKYNNNGYNNTHLLIFYLRLSVVDASKLTRLNIYSLIFYWYWCSWM